MRHLEIEKGDIGVCVCLDCKYRGVCTTVRSQKVSVISSLTRGERRGGGGARGGGAGTANLNKRDFLLYTMLDWLVKGSDRGAVVGMSVARHVTSRHVSVFLSQTRLCRRVPRYMCDVS